MPKDKLLIKLHSRVVVCKSATEKITSKLLASTLIHWLPLSVCFWSEGSTRSNSPSVGGRLHLVILLLAAAVPNSSVIAVSFLNCFVQNRKCVVCVFS